MKCKIDQEEETTGNIKVARSCTYNMCVGIATI